MVLNHMVDELHYAWVQVVDLRVVFFTLRSSYHKTFRISSSFFSSYLRGCELSKARSADCIFSQLLLRNHLLWG